MTFSTADLCDAHAGSKPLQIAEPIFTSYGGHAAFSGQITTLKVFEDPTLLESTLQEKVLDRVLVIDGGGFHHCALLGDALTRLAIDNGWQGIILYGSIRNRALLDTLPIGIRALHTYPLRSDKHDHGESNISVTFAGVQFKKDHFLYADEDGIIVSETKLS
ncbi:MAG: ribonuclease [Gammaproteobacteria bacterium HGW-Gammaproteobacteria-3]|jgi:regulator of ribonuclease activity A|nr:MAG: ribonuclease [Gammaproteobacteria bacterium HGW-Gammaproteobacteria-3]